MRPKRREWVARTLRLPTELHKAVEDAAWSNRRSVNAQIVHILEQWVAAEATDAPEAGA